MTTKNQKLISLRVPAEVVSFLEQKSKNQGRTISNYIRWLIIQQMDQTEYLMSTKANKKILLESINQANNQNHQIRELID